jgi:hypothetical protein
MFLLNNRNIYMKLNKRGEIGSKFFNGGQGLLSRIKLLILWTKPKFNHYQKFGQ